jgi:hypothetical protein
MILINSIPPLHRIGRHASGRLAARGGCCNGHCRDDGAERVPGGAVVGLIDENFQRESCLLAHGTMDRTQNSFAERT